MDSTGVAIPEQIMISLDGAQAKRKEVIIGDETAGNQSIISDFLSIFPNLLSRVDNVCPEGLNVEFTVQKSVTSDIIDYDYNTMSGDDTTKVDAFLTYIAGL